MLVSVRGTSCLAYEMSKQPSGAPVENTLGVTGPPRPKDLVIPDPKLDSPTYSPRASLNVLGTINNREHPIASCQCCRAKS